MKQIRRLSIAAQIELHWTYIAWCRRIGLFLIGHGTSFQSKILLKLSEKIDHHGILAFRLQDQYDAMFTLS